MLSLWTKDFAPWTDPALWTSELLGIAIKATVLLLFATVATLVARRSSAAARHQIWSLALVSILLLAPLAAVAPGWEVRGLPFGNAFTTELPKPTETAAPIASAEADPSTSVTPLPADVASAPTGLTPVPAVVSASANLYGESTPAVTEALTSSPSPRRAFPWAKALGLIWLVGSTLLWARFLLGHVLLWRWGHDAHPLNDKMWSEQLAAGQTSLRMNRSVRLLRSTTARSPLTWGVWRPRILLPPQSQTWDASRRADVLLHELAHIRRGDLITRLVAQIVAATLWFHPLVWWALRELNRQAELACDDEVITAGETPSTYASHLLDIARHLRSDRLAAAASISMARPGALSTRLRSILDPTRARGGMPLSLRLGVLGLLIGLVLPLAGMQSASSAGGGSSHEWKHTHNDFSIRSSEDDGRGRWTVKDRDYYLDVEYDGELGFSEDERELRPIDPDGYVRIEEEGDEDRRLEITIGPDGSPAYEYQVGRDDRPFDDEGRQWLAGITIKLIRTSGVGAEERVERIYREGGLDAVLTEIDELNSDYVGAIYYGALIQEDELSSTELAEVAGQMARDIDSDYETAELLLQFPQDRLEESNEVRSGYFRVVRTIDSDYERRRVLSDLASRIEVDGELTAGILETAQQIDSDYEKAELLVQMAPYHDGNQDALVYWMNTVDTIDSDYERGRCLKALLRTGVDDPSLLIAAAHLIGEIDSDYEKAELLSQYARLYRDDPELRNAYEQALDTIGSDHEYGRASRAFYRGDSGQRRDRGDSD